VLLFSRQVCKKYRQQVTIDYRPILFSLDRITCPDIYRAGDGVHRAYLKTKGFTLNPLHLSYLWLERRTFANARAIIANSRMVRDQILRYYPATDPAKIHVVYNGIPLPDPVDKAAAKAALARELDFDPNLPVILFVGSGFARKGVTEFLEILTHLNHDYSAFVVGKEKHLARYRLRAKKFRISDKVTFTGPRRDVERFYAAADIFLFPTHYEPFSNVVLEALSYGDIVFTTRQNGAAEILEDRYIMERPDDPETSEKIDRLLADPEQLRREQEKAWKLSEQFSIERNVAETLKVLDKIQKNS
jgi:UDP-glucose:(heptosyl)LPS alpha-1,3-glucosyltransferase